MVSYGCWLWMLVGYGWYQVCMDVLVLFDCMYGFPCYMYLWMLYCPFYWCWMMYTVVHSIGYSLLCSMDARLFITTILTRQGILLPYYLEITVAITNGNKVAIFLDVIVVIGIHRAQDHKMILFSFFSSARKETNCYHFMVLCTKK